MKLIYLGIDLLAPVLKTALEEGHTVARVYTCPTDNVTEFNKEIKRLAAEHGIPCTEERITREEIRSAREEGCHLILCAAYYYRVPVVEGIAMVNVHPSFLPTGRGSWPMPWTILKGLKRSGVTFHKMTEAFDEGDILLQREILLGERENLKTLSERQKALLPDMTRELLTCLPDLDRKAVPQGEGSYWPFLEEQDYPLSKETAADEADRILRAFFGYECIYMEGEKKWGLLEGVFTAEKQSVQCFPVQGGWIRAQKVRRL